MTSTLFAAVALGAAFVANAQAATQDPASSPMRVYGAPAQTDTDQRITNEVVDAIASDRRMRGQGVVQVRTDRGVVTLTGRVSTFVTADRAGEVASSVQGVRSVDDQVNPRVGKNF